MLLAGLSLATGAAWAQAPLPAPSPAPAADEDPVRLPKFEVSDRRAGAYGARETTSTTRISLPIQDLAQTVSAVTRELIDDTQSLRMIDAARFVTPILEGNQAAGDVYTIRGFRTLIRFIDGVSVGVLDETDD